MHEKVVAYRRWPNTESMNYLYEIIALTVKIRQTENTTLIKTDLFLIFPTCLVQFVHALMGSSEFFI